jgi:hypothetical protein
MHAKSLTPDDDYLLHHSADTFATVASDLPNWFERLYFNFHDREGSVLALTGFGVFPNMHVADAYVAVTDATAQRNVRLCRDLGGRRSDTSVGPLALTLVEPMRRWRLELQETEGVAFDVVFEARTIAQSVGVIEFDRGDGSSTAFRHYNQAGDYSGTLSVDGRSHAVEGWIGQRDHSWGLRYPRERQGLHFWIAAHFDDRTFMASYNESRQHEVVFCEGAVLFTDDRPPIPVIDVRHELTVTDNGQQSAEAEIRMILADGSDATFLVRPALPDLYMSGCGYGGWQGQHRGPLHVESERWEHGHAPDLRHEPTGVVDQLATFEWNGQRGVGVFELGVSRSSSYAYAPRR